MALEQGHDVKRYRPPIPPQARDEVKVCCEWKTTMPKMRDGGGIGGQMFSAVLLVSISLCAGRTLSLTKALCC